MFNQLDKIVNYGAITLWLHIKAVARAALLQEELKGDSEVEADLHQCGKCVQNIEDWHITCQSVNGN